MLWALVTLGFLVAFVAPLVIAIWRQRQITLASIWCGIGVVLYVVLHTVVQIYPDTLLFKELGQLAVYWIGFWPKLWWFAIGGAVAALFLFANTLITRTHLDEDLKQDEDIKFGYLIAYGIGGLLALIFAGCSTTFWDQYLWYSHHQPFPATDPVFGNNNAFYVFTLPYFQMLLHYSWALLLLTFTGVTFLYVFLWKNTPERKSHDDDKRGAKLQALQNRIISHLSILGVFAVILLIFTVKTWQWGFLTSNHTTFTGAGYVDITQRISYYSFFVWVLIASALMLIVSALARSLRFTAWFAISGAGLAIVYLLLFILIIPAWNQRFNIRPNELSYETPNIERNKEATKFAFSLQNVQVVPYHPSTEPITRDVLRNNQHTLQMTRVWDWTALDANIQNNQSFRTYFHFPEPDVVRYYLDGQLTQVMTSVRELDQSMIPSNTWQNRMLVYTHGFGMVAVPVSGFDANGDPTFLMKNIPPATEHSELAITEPRIYYGELTNTDVFVNTKHLELDYPIGDTNTTCTYSGTGGIPLGSGLRNLVLALRYEGLGQLTAAELTPDSRIMVKRNIVERVKVLAPFLKYDNDPYSVVAEGRIWYLLDAYTTSNAYPYSMSVETNQGTLNYIRNSVKVVIDPYNGTVTFYIIDDQDPLIMTYASIFPTLFTSVKAAPASLVAHFRYAEGLFSVQSAVYSTYHMGNITTFYNREDRWDIATEEYHVAKVKQMNPYYAAVRLPGETTDEYILMLPFTPYSTDSDRPKNNMVAWLAGRCDAPHYGQLLVYEFPKDQIVTGPMQIEARINQHDQISKDLTLWNQQGSQVLKGNMMVIPLIGNYMLFVKPIFLQSSNGRYPELKRVIVATNDQLAYAETFESALRQLVGESDMLVGENASSDYIAAAAQYYQQYLKLTGEGKGAEAGQALDQLGSILKQALTQQDKKQ